MEAVLKIPHIVESICRNLALTDLISLDQTSRRARRAVRRYKYGGRVSMYDDQMRHLLGWNPEKPSEYLLRGPLITKLSVVRYDQITAVWFGQSAAQRVEYSLQQWSRMITILAHLSCQLVWLNLQVYFKEIGSSMWTDLIQQLCAMKATFDKCEELHIKFPFHSEASSDYQLLKMFPAVKNLQLLGGSVPSLVYLPNKQLLQDLNIDLTYDVPDVCQSRVIDLPALKNLYFRLTAMTTERTAKFSVFFKRFGIFKNIAGVDWLDSMKVCSPRNLQRLTFHLENEHLLAPMLRLLRNMSPAELPSWTHLELRFDPLAVPITSLEILKIFDILNRSPSLRSLKNLTLHHATERLAHWLLYHTRQLEVLSFSLNGNLRGIDPNWEWADVRLLQLRHLEVVGPVRGFWIKSLLRTAPNLVEAFQTESE